MYRKFWKKTLAFLLAGSLVIGAADLEKQESTMAAAATETDGEIEIDGDTVRTSASSLYRGLGAVTCNGSSRLLLDYKEENPEAYWEIMNWLFNTETGAGLTHIKIELGCDADTSSGAEPATKRTESETANVSRGAGFVFAHDALTINPDITVDLLCWGMPAWVEDAYEKSDAAGYKARYKWYKETLDAAYDTWGLEFSYVSANRNERAIETEWTIYLRDALDAEDSGRYDYSKIKLVAADESDTMQVAQEMLDNKEYRDAVDVIGCHYNSYMDENVQTLHDTYNKEIWYSEGASVATDSIFGANNTQDGETTTGTNGMLDIANRIIIAMAQSDMTLYEFQPAVAAYYDGSVYYPKQLIAANTPWSGGYTISNGLVMAMHFSNFIGQGWYIVDSGSYGDGTQADHAITDTENTYLTATDGETGDYSTVITNDSADTRTYTVRVSNLAKASAKVKVWETKTSDTDDYDANWLACTDTITPEKDGSEYVYTISVEPYSMVTLTTTTGQTDYAERKSVTSLAVSDGDDSLALAYEDDFEYTDEYLERRGNTPRYTTDLNGAFEVVTDENGNHVLQQQINEDTLSSGWSSTKDPVTSLGDDTWKDYIVSADVMLDPDEDSGNYAAICARYNASAGVAENGYWLRIYRSGRWKLISSRGTIAKGKISGMSEGRVVNLKIKVLDNTVTAYINNEKVAKKTVKKSAVNSGRVAFGSAYCKNIFDNLKVLPISGGVTHITRVDDLSSDLTFTGTVSRLQSQSYVYYGRTVSTLETSATVKVKFTGTGISFLGTNLNAPQIKVTVDGEVIESSYKVKSTSARTAFYQVTGLPEGTHKVKITVLGKEALKLDAVEIAGAEASVTTTKAKSISLKYSDISLAYGETMSLGVTTAPEAAAEDVTYTTSNMAVAVVTADGSVYGNGAGTATITATTKNGLTAQATVTVTELAVTPGSGIRVGAGERVKLSAAYVDGINEAEIAKWSSGDETLATVTKKGVVHTLAEGDVTITATGANGYSGSVVVHIRKAPYRFTVSPKSKTMNVGDTKQITYDVPSGCCATTVAYQSSNKKVAKVSKSGLITAKGSGTCKITVTLYNGKTKKITVTVK